MKETKHEKENKIINNVSRRQALISSTHIAAGALFFPAVIPASALGQKKQEKKKTKSVPANERINLGIIACGNRARSAKAYKSDPRVHVAAVCDPNRDRRNKFKAMWNNCDDYSDFRELLARKDIDAVHISTQDHWHVPISLAAARAGKDTYTEKPLGISVEQCLAAREIADKHKRIFQYGTQNRSMAQVRLGIELVLNGYIGEVKELYVWCPPGVSGGKCDPIPVPEGFDFNLWLGPAPETEFCHDRCLNKGQGNGIFHIYDYAIGFIAGWGAHPMDQLQWWVDNGFNAGMGDPDIPVTYEGTGVIPESGLFNTITTWDMTCTYKNGLIMKFMDNRTAKKEGGILDKYKIKFGHGTLFVGSKGWVCVSRGKWKVHPVSLYKEVKNIKKKILIESKSHTGNFIDAVLSRENPISNLHSAVKSDIICHLSDISIRTGRKITWDPDNETILGDAEAAKMISRPMRKPWTL